MTSYFCLDIARIILSYDREVRELADWTPRENLYIDILCRDPNLLFITREEYKRCKFSQNLDWKFICQSEDLIDIIEDMYEFNHSHLDWNALYNNKKAIPILLREYKSNPESDNLDWFDICKSENMIDLIDIIYKDNPELIEWGALINNKKADHIILKEIELLSDVNLNNYSNIYEYDFDTSDNYKVVCIKRWLYNKKYPNNGLHIRPNRNEITTVSNDTYDHNEINLLKYKYEKNIQLFEPEWTTIHLDEHTTDIIFTEYKTNPNSVNLQWSRLYDARYADIIFTEYKANPLSYNLNWYLIHKVEALSELLIAEYKHNPQSKKLKWKQISSNPIIYKYLPEEYLTDLRW